MGTEKLLGNRLEPSIPVRSSKTTTKGHYSKNLDNQAPRGNEAAANRQRGQKLVNSGTILPKKLKPLWTMGELLDSKENSQNHIAEHMSLNFDFLDNTKKEKLRDSLAALQIWVRNVDRFFDGGSNNHPPDDTAVRLCFSSELINTILRSDNEQDQIRLLKILKYIWSETDSPEIESLANPDYIEISDPCLENNSIIYRLKSGDPLIHSENESINPIASEWMKYGVSHLMPAVFKEIEDIFADQQ